MKARVGSIYGVVDRLSLLCQFLRNEPRTYDTIHQQFPQIYDFTDSGRRMLRYDLHNLRYLGYDIRALRRPARWQVVAGPVVLSDDDVNMLIPFRDAFDSKHPMFEKVQAFFGRVVSFLTENQQKQWQRSKVFSMPLRTAIDYTNYEGLIAELEKAIQNDQQIAFWYRSPTSEQPIEHPRVDPYEIIYVDGHFYLEAYSYLAHAVLTFRLDRFGKTPRSSTIERYRGQRQPRRHRKPISFTYRLPASFGTNGVSERFTTHATHVEGQYLFVEASDSTEFRIMRTLLGYGERALLVDGPPSLIAKMRDVTRAMHELYEPLDS